ncbi:rab escort protein [Moniliophthora roreri MCA 2997]|uniref:Rab escort protein n=1 Tax=Moniliophthora roreri (strain MCA 2997) TaxID=1381753 RepID=V2X1T1_MONRO|nr:rab escort protein [Moniliophthora roreri MCA 2997]KAI3619870.1 rab escort protein [Moniliophthora roreri]
MDSDEGAFDIVIVGTGLTESIAAAALSKAGFKVAQIDENPYYGADEASLTQDEFIQWQDKLSVSTDEIYTSFSRTGEVLPQSRQYSISLSPAMIPSTGPLISSLIQSRVSRYGGFRLIQQVAVYNSSGSMKPVPGSKEDIFKDRSISLVDKRRLMRFLQFAVGDFSTSKELVGMEDAPYVEFLKSKFSLNEDMAIAIAYALSYCQSPIDPTLPALQRIHRYLLSAGRYGSSPFLLGHYGSSGEISQGFCRTSAVSGGVYILGKTLKSVRRADKSQSTADTDTPEYIIHFDEWSEALTCKVMISSATRIPRELLPESKHAQLRHDACSTTVARCVAIIDKPLSFVPTRETGQSGTTETEAGNDEQASSPSSDQIDAGVLIFPPDSLSSGSASSAVDVLIVGEGTMSTPQGKWILYLSTLNPENIPPKDLLQPYLDTTLSLASTEAVSPLFTSFYNRRSPAPSDASTPSDAARQSFKLTDLPNYILVPQLPTLPLTEPPDIAAVHAETVFWDALRILRPEGNMSASAEGNAPRFWPPLPDDENEEGEA